MKELRERLDIEKYKQKINCSQNEKIQDLISLFQKEQISFYKFDDVVIYRLVECIRVSKEKRITVILKGGLKAESVL